MPRRSYILDHSAQSFRNEVALEILLIFLAPYCQTIMTESLIQKFWNNKTPNKKIIWSIGYRFVQHQQSLYRRIIGGSLYRELFECSSKCDWQDTNKPRDILQSIETSNSDLLYSGSIQINNIDKNNPRSSIMLQKIESVILRTIKLYCRNLTNSYSALASVKRSTRI